MEKGGVMVDTTDRLDAVGTGLTVALSAATGLAAGWIAYSALAIDHNVPLPSAIDAPRQRFAARNTYALNFYVDRSQEGRPLLLLHSINAAASSYEVRPLFEHYRSQRPVYALDMPGFGFSERVDQVYTPYFYADTIANFLRERVREPADLIAMSLTSEFAARAALQVPDLVRSLTMISPSGFTAKPETRESQQTGVPSIGDRLHNFLTFPLWSQALFDALTIKPSIRYFLKQSFAGPVDEGLVNYSYASSHQPGARHAPFYFVSGKLFTPDIRQQVYEKLANPVLVLYDQDNFVRFDTLPNVLARHTNWHAERITPTCGLPHFEQLAQTTHALDSFWQGID